MGMPKTGQSVQYILSVGFLVIPMMDVRLKEFFSSTVKGTQVWYKEQPVKGHGTAPMVGQQHTHKIAGYKISQQMP
jgi:hypothetical protein